jgi:hypothetical protein
LIKALTREIGKQPMLILGLSDENWQRLRNGGDEGLGQPIKFDLAELGLPPLIVVITGGETEEKLRDDLFRTFRTHGVNL